MHVVRRYEQAEREVSDDQRHTSDGQPFREPRMSQRPDSERKERCAGDRSSGRAV
jgi:hypothetical protein